MAAKHELSVVTSDSTPARASDIPSLDRLLTDAVFAPLLTNYARTQVTGALRGELERLRGRAANGSKRRSVLRESREG